ncbi:hypothetical protein [Kibdelosporangium phytohabitans]|uniref:DUF4034 domain-containing protein n=1 Tax=Kibdelosporangium phytohabitans TaxID=860235 RepID=A0A0N9HS63_9PSEU|nr:hypothetical protein [Kibdelosporangium phytohabitans]ALG06037.1 hypothetical protein AOZ06_03090 [Kibdelosporangium phytohabitans]MBE1465888.1 hypothetical protein [Kibdelosporangium phytohabitans]
MGLFGRKKAALPRREVIWGHCYEDDLLDAADAELGEGKLNAAVTVLVDSRDNAESRCLRLSTLGHRLVGSADEIAELAAQHRDPELMLLAGDAYIGEAWAIRGSGWASSVGEDRAKLFRATLEKARRPLFAAADMLPGDPTPWAQLLAVGMGLGQDRSEQDAVWAETVKRGPTLFPAHWTRLQVVAQKWYGSQEEMSQFAVETVNNAPQGDPVTAMIVVAYFETYIQAKVIAQEEYKNPDLRAVAEGMFEKNFQPIEAASNRWMKDERPHPRAFEAHNYFAAACGLAGEKDRAFMHLFGMRDRMSGRPWSTFADDPEEAYQDMVQRYWRPDLAQGF